MSANATPHRGERRDSCESAHRTPCNNRGSEGLERLERSSDHLEILLDWANSCCESALQVESVRSNSASRIEDLLDGDLLYEILENLCSSSSSSCSDDTEGFEMSSQDAGLGRVVNRLCALLDVKRSSSFFKWIENDSSNGDDRCSQLTGEQKELEEEDAHRVAEVIQLVLGYAVQCPRKGECVSHIMSLEASAQHALMIEVDFALKRIAHLKSAPPTPSPFSKGMIASARKSAVQRGSQLSATPQNYNSTNNSGALKRALRENHAIRAENEEIQASNVELQRALEATRSELGKLRSEAKETVLRKELELGNTFDEREKTLKTTLESKNAELERLNAQIAALTLEAKASASLRDQVEVLTAQVGESSKKDLAIVRLKEKAMLASDLGKQVAVLEESNASLLERSVQAEAAAKAVAKLRKELETCKEAHTEALLNLNETRSLLEARSQQLRALQDDHSTLHEENAMLQSDLGLAEQQSSLGDELGGLGGSNDADQQAVSELNPRVRENLARLERENEALRANLSEQSEDNVSRLAFENDSLQRLRSKLEEQLSVAAASIKSLTQRLKESEKELIETRETHAASTQSMQAAHTSSLEAAEQAHTLAAQQWAKESARLQSELEARGSELDAAKAEARIEAERLMACIEESNAQAESESRRILEEQHTLQQELATEKAQALETVTSLQEQLAASQACLASAQKEHEAYEQDHRVSIEDYEQEQGELRQTIDRLEAELDAKRALVAAREQDLADARCNALEREKAFEAQSQDQLEQGQAEYEKIRAACDATEKTLSETAASLQETQAALESECSLRQKAEHAVDRYRLECDDLSHQLNQARRQLKAAQVQREQAAARQAASSVSEDQDLLLEMQSLLAKNKRLQSEIAGLRSSGATENGNTKNKSMVNKSVPEVARAYEKQILDLEKTIDSHSMAKTQALLERKEIELKYQKLVKESDELQVENNRMRLQVERYRTSIGNFKIQQQQQQQQSEIDKENVLKTPRASALAARTPSSKLHSVAKSQACPSPLGRSHQENNQHVLASQPQPSDENNAECNQQ